jgi:hypothetical protein
VMTIMALSMLWLERNIYAYLKHLLDREGKCNSDGKRKAFGHSNHEDGDARNDEAKNF